MSPLGWGEARWSLSSRDHTSSKLPLILGVHLEARERPPQFSEGAEPKHLQNQPCWGWDPALRAPLLPGEWEQEKPEG